MTSFTDSNGIFWADPVEVGYGPGSNLGPNRLGRPKSPPVQRVIDSFGGIPCQHRRPDDAPNRPGEICGLIHDRCTGHVRARATDPEQAAVRLPNKGNPCSLAALRGGVLCNKHGIQKGVREKADANYQAQQAAKLVGKLAASKGVPVDDPAGALSQLAGEMREWNAAVQELVAGLESPLIGDGDLHPLVALAERSHARFEKALHGMVKLGLVEQRLHLEESKLAVVERALVAVFVAHGLDPDVGRMELAEQLLELDALEASGRELEAGGS